MTDSDEDSFVVLPAIGKFPRLCPHRSLNPCDWTTYGCRLLNKIFDIQDDAEERLLSLQFNKNRKTRLLMYRYYNSWKGLSPNNRPPECVLVRIRRLFPMEVYSDGTLYEEYGFDDRNLDDGNLCAIIAAVKERASFY